jgi:hypothetical protein
MAMNRQRHIQLIEIGSFPDYKHLKIDIFCLLSTLQADNIVHDILIEWTTEQELIFRQEQVYYDT